MPQRAHCLCPGTAMSNSSDVAICEPALAPIPSPARSFAEKRVSRHPAFDS
jgi:hypothetical protein